MIFIVDLENLADYKFYIRINWLARYLYCRHRHRPVGLRCQHLIPVRHQYAGHPSSAQYEDITADTKTPVKCIFDYCGLPFEPACLEFYKTDRAVRTAS